MTINEIKEGWEKIGAQYEIFLLQECASNHSNSSIIYFLDSNKIFIGVTPVDNGSDWIIEINGIIVEVCDDRQSAEEFAIRECLQILEDGLNKNNI